MTKKHNYAAEHPAEYEQGRRSRLSNVSKDDAPFDAGTDTLKAWQAGFDDAEPEAARNETSGPQDAPKGGDQLHAVADANKASAKR